MITAKELQYVDFWASKIPMPGLEYSSKVMDEIEECYNIFNQLYRNKEYDFIFSNGEEIGFQIYDKNLSHMLGIDYKNIKDVVFTSLRKNVLGINSTEFSSFELLESLIENKDKVIESDNNKNVNLKLLNYYKLGIKCAIFKKMCNFNQFNFGAINKEFNDEKYLFVPSNEAVCPYFMISIKKEGENDTTNVIPKYIVNSLIAPQEPCEFFKDMEVIIPTQILISDASEFNSLNATAIDKIQLLTMYKNIINMYRLPNKLNIYSDYEVMLNERVNIDKTLVLNKKDC